MIQKIRTVVFLLMLFYLNNASFAQSVEVYYGINTSSFYFNKNKANEEIPLQIPYQGTSFGIMLDQSDARGPIPSVSLQFDEHHGFVRLENPSNYTEIYYLKRSLSLAVYILNKKFWNNFYVHSGLEVSALLEENFEENCCGVSSFANPDLNEENFTLSRPAVFFLKNRLAYDFKIKGKLSIRSQYSFSIGTTKEFFLEPNVTHSFRHFFGLSLVYKMNA